MSALSTDQLDYFEAFGFIVLRRLLSADELQGIVAEADRSWQAQLGRAPLPGEVINMSEFVERSPALTKQLVLDDRLYQPLVQLLGPDMIWGGSEGNRGVQSKTLAHDWHADRPGPSQLGYRRVKVMLYLDPMTRQNGALRVLPGSHRPEFHLSLMPLQEAHLKDERRFFGLPGDEIPAWSVETEPGDVLLFHHCLFHAVYGRDAGERRYVALKLAARPQNAQQIEALGSHSQKVYTPAREFAESAEPRIRGMVAPISKLRTG